MNIKMIKLWLLRISSKLQIDWEKRFLAKYEKTCEDIIVTEEEARLFTHLQTEIKQTNTKIYVVRREEGGQLILIIKVFTNIISHITKSHSTKFLLNVTSKYKNDLGSQCISIIPHNHLYSCRSTNVSR